MLVCTFEVRQDSIPMRCSAVVHQGWILYRFNPMADALRAQLTYGLPDTFRAGRFARVDGDMPPGVAGFG